MSKKMLFVFNPFSGKGQLKNYLYDVIDVFTKDGYEVTVYPTQGKDDAFNIVGKTAHKYDVITASGGDGTLNEAVRGIMKYPIYERRLIGYIPSGTTNDFAMSRDIPKDPIKAAEKILHGTPVAQDVGMLNGRVFNYVAAFGAFTDVSYDTPQEAKNFLGQAAYLVEGIKRLSSIGTFRVKFDGDDVCGDDEFCVGCILNSTSMAGISFGGKYDIKLDDGLFEAVMVKMPVSIMQLHEMFTTVLKGGEATDQFRLIRTSKLSIEFDEEVKWTLDGEYGGAYKTAEIEIRNKAVEFIL